MADSQQRKLAALMFTDMVGYSALTQKSEPFALELLEEHRRLLRPLFPRHDSKEVKTIGDAFLVEFASAVEAARCAIDIQKKLAEYNLTAAPERGIQVRIGLHVGDVVYQENDVLGDGVNIASRIQPLADPGGICVSEDVARQIQNKIEFPVLRLGPTELKNIQMPVAIYRIVLPWEKEKAPTPLVTTPWTIKTLRYAVLGALVALVAIGSGWWALRRDRAIRPGQITSLAVLPLENLAGDPEQEYFSDGMTEALIAELSRIGALKVISRTSSMQYKRAKKPLPQIARELNVDGIIEGSVLREGETVRVTVQLIHGPTDKHLWAESYQRELRSVLALQSEVARAVVNEIRVKLTPQEQAWLARTRRINPEAHAAYLKGWAE